jgi:hypothetical protein
MVQRSIILLTGFSDSIQSPIHSQMTRNSRPIRERPLGTRGVKVTWALELIHRSH